jgi:DNA replication initiation complex subunit (GINS family)
MEQQVVTITYETLFDILRVEKGRDDIQEISPSFYKDVIVYLQQKKEVLVKKEHESGIDSFDEVKKARIQYENVQRLVKEICQRREKKILLLALNCSRTQQKAIQSDALLEEEKLLFERLRFVLDENYKNIISPLIKGKMPTILEQREEGMQNAKVQETIEKQETEEPKETSSMEQLATTMEQTTEATTSPQEGMMIIQFLTEVDQFIGPELETYGPFNQGATASIPEKIAAILINSGKAERDSESNDS